MLLLSTEDSSYMNMKLFPGVIHSCRGLNWLGFVWGSISFIIACQKTLGLSIALVFDWSYAELPVD